MCASGGTCPPLADESGSERGSMCEFDRESMGGTIVKADVSPLKAEDSALYVRLWCNLSASGASPVKQVILSA